MKIVKAVKTTGLLALTLIIMLGAGCSARFKGRLAETRDLMARQDYPKGRSQVLELLKERPGSTEAIALLDTSAPTSRADRSVGRNWLSL